MKNSHPVRLCISLCLSLACAHSAHADLLRIGAWNTFNNPDNTTEDASFATVFQAIGDEVIAGNAGRLDLMAFSESDTGSSARLPIILNDLYTTDTYAVTTATSDGGSDRTGFVYDAGALDLITTTELSAGITHNTLRGQFRPVGTDGSLDLYAYAIHLKSGSSTSDKTTRAAEAALIRADADALGDGTHVIYLGDFNMQGSSEGAWGNLLAAGPGQALDVAGAPGEWRDNADFLHLHTQDPRSNMDDRFDLMLASSELLDSVGLDYVPNSFTVLGNDASHTLGQAITTGTGATPAVFAALTAASDHLPIFADFTIPEPATFFILLILLPIIRPTRL